MSKILVIALLAINILMAGFHVVGASSGPTTSTVSQVPTPDPKLPQIRLVGEANLLRRSGTPGLQCYTVGPFETEEAMWRAHDALYDLSIDLRQRRTEALMELGYWVALPAFGNFAAAGATMRELQRAGLEDMAVVNNDPGVFYLSLGYFLDERNARRRRDQVRELGYEANTRLQRETQPRWWLDFARAPGTGNVEETLQPLVPAGLNRGIPCPSDITRIF